MAVVVTGAHGFVGLNVVRRLALEGVDTIAVGRNPPDDWVIGFLADVAAKVTHVQADLSQPGALASAVQGDVQAVIHAAVVTATTPKVERDESMRIVSVNIGGTMEALNLAREREARRFMYVSSPSAFGMAGGEELVDESVDKRPESLYGITKDVSEDLARRYGVIHGLSTVSVRIAQPYGPGERATSSRLRTSPIYEWLLAAKAGEPLLTGPLSRGRDWTYIDDTARGIVDLALAGDLQHGLYHLARSSTVIVGDVIEQLRSVYPDIETVENEDHPDLNPNIAGPAERRPLDSSRFRSEFGWAPDTGIEDGMARYLAWWHAFQPVGQTG